MRAVAAQFGQPGLQCCKGIRSQAVVNPAAALSIRQQPRFAKHPEMKRELRLGEVEITGEVTDAAFTLRERMDYVEADRVGQCFEQLPRLLAIEGVLDHKSSVPRSVWINII